MYRDNGAHLWEKHAFFAYLFLCSSSKWQVPYLIEVYLSYIIVIIQAFYHNNPFLSVSYLHCFLFVCFYFRPLNKKSKVRCLKLFLLFFSLKQGCWYAFYSPLGWERESMKGTEGWGQTSSVTSPWSHLLGFMVYCSTYYRF